MPKTEAPLSMFGITQDFIPDHWNWTDAERASMGDLPAMCKIIEDRIVAAYPSVSIAECHAICHDKDEKQIWDEAKLCLTPVFKTHHGHFLVKLAGGKLTISEIAAAVGLEMSFIEKPHAGRWAYDNMLAYLIHAKDASKHQYSPTEVYTHKGEAYMGIYHLRCHAWEQGRAKREKAEAGESIDWLLNQILTGKISKSEVMLTDSYYAVYAAYARKCDDAFETYGQRKAYMVIRAMENKDFEIVVFYITGKSGAGKSFFTDMFVNRLISHVHDITGVMWQKCTVASSNPLDDWNGEEILVMDDLRGMAMTASDWLKLLDPERANRAGTRYKNKYVVPRVVVINAEKDVVDFFYFLKGIGGGNRSEAMDQFIRRIMSRVYVVEDPTTHERLVSVNDSMKLPNGQTVIHTIYEETGEAVNGRSEMGTRAVGDVRVSYAFGHDPSHEGMTFDDAVDYMVERTMSKNKKI